MDKYYKIVFGFGETDYLPIKADELHTAQVIALHGGKANFEAGFFQNRDKDIMRIVPDWHKAKGWNRGYKMGVLDFEDVAPLEETYNKTLRNSRLLAEYIIKEKKLELLTLPASQAFSMVSKLLLPSGKYAEVTGEVKNLVDKIKTI